MDRVHVGQRRRRVLRSRARAAGLDARALAPARVAAIGPGTERALARRGIRADLVPDRFVAESLARRVPEARDAGERVLIARRAGARRVARRTRRTRLRGRRARGVPDGSGRARCRPTSRACAPVRSTPSRSRRRRRSPTSATPSARSTAAPVGDLDRPGDVADRPRPRAARSTPRPTRTPSTASSTRCSRDLRPPERAPGTDGYHRAVSFPEHRLRRLRRTPALRRLVAEHRVRVDDLVAPLFVKEGIDAPEPVVSMPGVVQHTQESLRKEVRALADLGVPAVMLFGIPERTRTRAARRPTRPTVSCRSRCARLRRSRRRPGADGRRLPRRVHRPRSLRPAHARRRGRQRRDPRALRDDRGRAGRRRRRRDRAVGDDGRSGRRDPRALDGTGHSDVAILAYSGEVRVGALRTVPRRGRMRAAVR